jgi:hypothetical protein
MTTAFCRKHAVLHCILAGWLLLAGCALGESRSMNCDSKLPATHAQLAEGDQSTANHLELSRKITSGASVDLDICAADLAITASGSDLLRVTVDIGNPAQKLTAADYLQALDVTSQGVAIQLHLPKSVRAKVVVAIPSAIAKLEVDLVSGDLSFQTDRIGGKREINVVRGHVELLGNADSYASLHVDVVMGSFHDHRKGGEDHHFMVSQSLSGTGKGSIEINVVAGRVDIKAWD